MSFLSIQRFLNYVSYCLTHCCLLVITTECGCDTHDVCASYLSAQSNHSAAQSAFSSRLRSTRCSDRSTQSWLRTSPMAFSSSKAKFTLTLSSTNLFVGRNNCKPDCFSQLSATADELNTATAQLPQKRGQWRSARHCTLFSPKPALLGNT